MLMQDRANCHPNKSGGLLESCAWNLPAASFDSHNFNSTITDLGCQLMYNFTNLNQQLMRNPLPAWLFTHQAAGLSSVPHHSRKMALSSPPETDLEETFGDIRSFKMKKKNLKRKELMFK